MTNLGEGLLILNNKISQKLSTGAKRMGKGAGLLFILVSSRGVI
jgi:hypothetical protein